MAARRGLGDVDPFDQPRRPRIAPVIPAAPGHEAAPDTGPDAAETGMGGPVRRKAWGYKQPPASKRQISVYVERDVADAARDAVHALTGREEGPPNLSALYQAGIASEVRRLQETFNDGKPFPVVNRKLKAGRPT